MGSPTRTRARKTAQAQAKADEVSQEELDLAAAQENEPFKEAQMGYLQQRVALLRVENNRLRKEIERLTAAAE